MLTSLFIGNSTGSKIQKSSQRLHMDPSQHWGRHQIMMNYWYLIYFCFSKQYDYRTVDPTWICVFCHKPSHYQGLGDLFGPYFIPAKILKNNNVESAESPKKGVKKGRRKSDVVVETNQNSGDDDKAEIWFHEDCYIWVPCTKMVGGRLVGTEEAVEQCQGLRCVVCGLRGASVGCTSQGCRAAAHLNCATDHGWSLDIHNFRVKCSKCINRWVNIVVIKWHIPTYCYEWSFTNH